LAFACGDSTSTPASPSPAPPVADTASSLRVVGVPAFLSPGATAQLKAEVTFSSGMVKECATVAWSVNDPAVASISPTGLLTATTSGYFAVSGSCEQLTTKVETKVEVVNPYSMVIVAYDKEVPTEFGVAGSLEFLDGSRAGQIIRTGDAIGGGVPNIPWPVKVRVTAESYEPKEFLISESTGKRRNPMSTLYDFGIPMTFVRDALTDTSIRQMSQTESEIVHPFVAASAGPVRIRTWWSVDYNDVLRIALWCDGQKLRETDQRFGATGSGLNHELTGPGRCEVRLRQLKSDAHTKYRIAITYPH
jgi:hypothetical protein